ncbi:MAG: chloride channel protein [Candidatus Riflebacteria bacterium]|nr:chloride channel protein [Candidatus Riflebacteria bacterium]
MSSFHISDHLKHSLQSNTLALFKWLVLSVFIGIIVGLVGVSFHFSLEYVTELRQSHPWLLLLMPIAGLIIVALYHFSGMEDDTGTERVITSVRSGALVKLRMAPLIYISTILTHLTGGSAGREGAALQLGGSISSAIGRFLKLDDRDIRVITMCGMATGFSALFGTPLAAAVFAMEVETVGVMYYAALVPCFLGSLTARQVAGWFNAQGTTFNITGVPNLLTPQETLSLILLGISCGILANIFCRLLEFFGYMYKKRFPNKWLRVLMGAITVIFVSVMVKTNAYNGAGIWVINKAMEGNVEPLAFFFKMLLTALTLNAGFKGGEIVPSFYVGATFGCFLGPVIGLDPSFAAGVGLVSVFCGVTNAPMTSIMLSYELFGGAGVKLMALAIAVSYMTSGYHSLFHSQKIAYSKIKAKYIDVFSDDNSDE